MMIPRGTRFLVLIGAVLTLASGANAQDEMIAAEPSPWQPILTQARFELNRGDADKAREVLEGLRRDFTATEAQDRAASGIASTYLQERRYREAIQSLDDSLTGTDLELPGSRQLYSAVERRIRRARNRAQSEVKRRESEYEEHSWWNIFRLFEKLDRRKKLKNAEKDLEELEDIYAGFEPRLLFPAAMPMVLPELDGLVDVTETTTEVAATEEEEATAEVEPADETEEEVEEATTTEEAVDESETAEKVTTGTDDGIVEETTPADEATEEVAALPEEDALPAAPEEGLEETEELADGTVSVNRQTAYDVLSDEIQDLVALIPEDKLAEADRILDGIPEIAALASAESGEASEATTGEIDTELTELADLPEEAAATSELTTGEASATEGTLALLEPDQPAAPADSQVVAAEVAPAAPTTPYNAREAYVEAYRTVQEAIRSGDQEAIKAARDAYLASVQAMRSSSSFPASPSPQPAASVDAGSTPEGAPSAPGDSATESATEAPQAPVQAAPQAPTGASATAAQGTVTQDRSGVQRGLSDGVLRQSRSSFQR